MSPATITKDKSAEGRGPSGSLGPTVTTNVDVSYPPYALCLPPPTSCYVAFTHIITDTLGLRRLKQSLLHQVRKTSYWLAGHYRAPSSIRIVCGRLPDLPLYPPDGFISCSHQTKLLHSCPPLQSFRFCKQITTPTHSVCIFFRVCTVSVFCS